MDELKEALNELLEATNDLKNHPTKANLLYVQALTTDVADLLDMLDDPYRGV